MVVGEGGELPLPWLAGSLADVLARQRGHSLLLHGAAGVGTLPFGLTLAQAWLCEGDGVRPPCGRCGSCRLVQSKLHPDHIVLLPEVARRALGWLLSDDKPEADDKKKPSKQIRIDEVRSAIDWAHNTSARGRGKVLLIHPAETMNVQAASALLKTLEEPSPGTRIALTVADPALLLATVRSRCQHVTLAAPPTDVAERWLTAQGQPDAAVLLAAASGRPLDALTLAEAGIDAAGWTALPRAIARGQGAALSGWPIPRAIDAMQKLCHDALAVAVGAPPRYFPAAAMPRRADMAALVDWGRALSRVARHDEHPWNEGLLLEALVTQGCRALTLAP